MLSKILLLVFIWFIWRLFRNISRAFDRSGVNKRGSRPKDPAETRTDHSDLTQQEISDADYEEIP
jgi:hypothetical protein